MPRHDTVPCNVSADSLRTVECGYVTTALDPNAPEAGTMRFPYQRFFSTADDAYPETVIYIDGGPGVPSNAHASMAQENADWFDSEDMAWLDLNDVIVFSQRGLVDTDPALICDAYEPIIPATQDGIDAFWDAIGRDLDRYLSTTPDLAVTHRVETVAEMVVRDQDCARELRASGFRPTLYNTRNIIEDVRGMIKSLDLGPVILWGASYGSRIALAYLDRYPEDVASVFVEAVLPPGIEDRFDEFDYLLDRLARVDSLCHEAGGCGDGSSPLDAFHQTMADLQDNPRRMFVSPEWRPRTRVVLDHRLYAANLQQLFYEAESLPLLPAYMQGDEDLLDEFILSSAEGDTHTEGPMYAVILCNDTDWRAKAASIRKPGNHPAIADFATWTYGYLAEACDHWLGEGTPRPKSAPVVVSDVPVLMLNGAWDAPTPAPMMWQQLETLENGWAFELEGLAHDGSNHECAHTIIANFFDDPTIDPYDPCVEDLAPPSFD